LTDHLERVLERMRGSIAAAAAAAATITTAATSVR